MNWWWIVLIVIGLIILMGPVMYGFAKLNGVDPWIREKSDEEIMKDEKSFILTGIFYPLFVPLWIEKKIINLLKR